MVPWYEMMVWSSHTQRQWRKEVAKVGCYVSNFGMSTRSGTPVGNALEHDSNASREKSIQEGTIFRRKSFDMGVC